MVDLVSLSLLPITLIERVLLHLEIQDIIHVGQTSSLFKDIALSELLWLRLLEQRWGNLTKPAEWRTDSPSGCFELPNCRLKYPGTYREYEKMVGVWIDADRNTLCVFSWKQNCILGTRLQFDSMASPALRSCFCCLSSEGEVSIDLQADARHCWLREYHMQAGRLRKSSCENAEAAARVAIGGNSAGSSELMGSSPRGSFEHELLRFMQMNVSSKRRKSRSKSPGQGDQAEIKCTYHLKYVELDQPTRAHPLIGMWKGYFGRFQGVQVLTISYDFSQRFAIVKAHKVGSHQDAYHEQPLWISNAQSCSFPWSARDQALIDSRQHYLVRRPAPLPEDDPQPSAPVSLTDESLPTWCDKTVVTSYRGKGRLLNTQDWYEGRLWQYRDGSLGFLCLVPDVEPEGILVDFGRINHELQGC